MSAPLRKGSGFDALILMRIHSGEDGASTAMSVTVRWIRGEKLARLDTANSAARRKPKYPKVHIQGSPDHQHEVVSDGEVARRRRALRALYPMHNIL